MEKRGPIRDFDALRNDPELLLLPAAIRELAEKAGLTAVAKTLGEVWKEAYDPLIQVTVMGGLNAGKSHLLNDLLGEPGLLPETALPQAADAEVGASAAEEAPYFIKGGERRPLSQLDKTLFDQATTPPLRLFIHNDWLRQEGILLSEKHRYTSLAEAKVYAATETFRRTDLLIFLIDALMAFTKQDVDFLQLCAELGIPTLVHVSKLDKLSPEERIEMLRYIDRFRQKIRVGFILPAESLQPDIPPQAELIRKKIAEYTNWQGVLEHRRSFVYQSAAACLLQLKEAVEAKLTESLTATAALDLQLAEQRRQMDNQQLQWVQLETELTAKRQVIERQLRDHLTKNRDAVLKSLNYDLDRSTDIKTWWERDLPYRLEREFLSLGGTISNGMNRQIAEHLKWLQQECGRIFGHPVSSFGDFFVTVEDMRVQQEGLPLTDNHNLRILTRIGTVVTVLAAGTLLVSSGIGGIVLATGALAGLGADGLIHAHTKKDREKARGELYRTVEKAEAQFVMDSSAKLKDTYDKIVHFLKQRQAEWQQEKLAVQEQHREKELQRIQAVDWAVLVKQIDEKLESVIEAPGIPSL